MRKNLGVISVAALSGMLGLAACGDDSGGSSGGSSSGGASPSAYVDAVCAAFGSITDKATAATKAFGDVSGDPAGAKKKVVDLVEGMSTAVDDGLAKIEKVGAPKAENGAAGHKVLVDDLRKMSQGLKEVKAAAAALDVTSPSSAQGFADIATKFTDSMKSFGDGLDGLKSKELEAAAAKSEACKKVGISS